MVGNLYQRRADIYDFVCYHPASPARDCIIVSVSFSQGITSFFRIVSFKTKTINNIIVNISIIPFHIIAICITV